MIKAKLTTFDTTMIAISLALDSGFSVLLLMKRVSRRSSQT
jgi:hypothetical protein